jgi:uncharacterized membrane protein YphA (DoxX/SURF4 family)
MMTTGSVSEQAPDTTPTAPTATAVRTIDWERRLQQAAIIFARLALAYLFFANIWWKTPPRFGCANDYAFGATAGDGSFQKNGSTGLCYYLSLESHYAPQERKVLRVDGAPQGGPTLGFDISPIAQLNAQIINGFIKPNIRWFGYVVWGGELLIAISLFFGLFTRIGALTAIAISGQLMVGLANIPSPYEWEWGYNLMVVLSVVMFAFAPGRYLGIDALLRRWFAPAAANKNLFARIGMLLT